VTDCYYEYTTLLVADERGREVRVTGEHLTLSLVDF
jgi:hypothetical protein